MAIEELKNKDNSGYAKDVKIMYQNYLKQEKK